MIRRLLIPLLVISACSKQANNPTAPSSGTADGMSAISASTAESKDAADDPTPFHILHPVEFGMIQGLVVFPPRTEPNLFFQNLQTLYRDTLRRPQTETFVDAEGQNVWLTEYFRFYLNGCSHEEASSRTLTEIFTGTTLATCGAENLTFPPRNLPNDFQNRLQAAYRDTLRRPATLSYVDSEGANVWLAQYLRFRVSGCDHATAESRVFTEIRGGGVQPSCARPGTLGVTEISRTSGVLFYGPGDSGSASISVGVTWGDFQARLVGGSPSGGNFFPHYLVTACFTKDRQILRHTCSAVGPLACTFSSFTDPNATCLNNAGTATLTPRVSDWMVAQDRIADVDGVVVMTIPWPFSYDRTSPPYVTDSDLGRRGGVVSRVDRPLNLRFSALPPNARAELSVTINPSSPVYSGQPVPGCSSGTWFYNQVIEETVGVGVTLLERVQIFNGQESSRTAMSTRIVGGGRTTFAFNWCASPTASHTVQTNFSARDDNGNTFTANGPVVQLPSLPR